MIQKFLQPSGPLRPKSWDEENEPIWKTEFKQRQAQEEVDYQKDMSQPYYQTHAKPTKEQWRRQRANRQGTVRKTEKVSAPVRAINNYVGRAKYEATHGGVTSPQYIYPALAALGVGAYGLAAAPVTMAASTVGGMAVGALVDTGTKLATDKTPIEDMSSDLYNKIYTFTFPNNKEVTGIKALYGWNKLMNRMPFNKVYYDPATYAEDIWARQHNIK